MSGQRHDPATLPTGKDPVTTVKEAGWALGPVWTGAENLAPTGCVCVCVCACIYVYIYIYIYLDERQFPIANDDIGY